MFDEIRLIVNYILRTHIEACEDNKFLMVSLTEQKSEGSIQVDCSGFWIKNFSINDFTKVWTNTKATLTIYFSDTLSNEYIIYTLKYNVLDKSMYFVAEYEFEPHVEDCKYYLIFKIETSKTIVRDANPNVDKYIKVIQANYPDVCIAYKPFAPNLIIPMQCSKLISEAFNDVLTYNTDTQFQQEMLQLFGGSLRRNFVKTMNKKLLTLYVEAEHDSSSDDSLDEENRSEGDEPEGESYDE